MIEVLEKKKEIIQIFDYIKDVYLKIFKDFLDNDTINRINNYNEEDIIIDETEEFRIRIDKKLEFRLNILDFIKNNDLNIDNNLDIGKDEIKKIEYLLENKDNPYKILKEELLESSIILFMQAKTVIEFGTASYITKLISEKCNIASNINYPKEMNLVENVIKVVGERNFLENVLSKNINNLIDIYNQYNIDINENNKLQNILVEADKIFISYYKNKNKVYYTDLLYYYSKLDYSKLCNKIEKIFVNRDRISHNMQKRIISIKECLEELNRYKIIYYEEEKEALYYASINIDGLLRKNDTMIKKYNRALEYENSIIPLAHKVWKYYINFEGNYNPDEQYYFLIENYDSRSKDKIKKVNLITNDNILISDIDNRFQYGFIYKIKNNSIIYSAPGRITYIDHLNDEEENINVLSLEDKQIEIEDQIYSRLMTPRMLLHKTKEEGINYNTVLLNKDCIYEAAIYCITNENKDDINYEKGLELSEKYDLPLIPLVKNK